MRFIALRARRDCEPFLLQDQDGCQAGNRNTDAHQSIIALTRGGTYERRIHASLRLG